MMAPMSILCLLAMNAEALSSPRKPSVPNAYSDARMSEPDQAAMNSAFTFHRRAILGAAITSSVALNGCPMTASALQERNEALCGTGFFTNIALYKCTEIGDISDEGKPRSLSTSEQGSMQALMNKMSLDVSVFDEDDKNNESKKGKRPTKSVERDAFLGSMGEAVGAMK